MSEKKEQSFNKHTEKKSINLLSLNIVQVRNKEESLSTARHDTKLDIE